MASISPSTKVGLIYGITKKLDAELLRAGSKLGFEQLLVNLSMDVLKLRFGEHWFKFVCLNREGESDYFKISASEPDRRLATMRLCHAAECLLNSYDDPVFDVWLQLAKNSHETAIAELQALCLLREAGLDARAKRPEGKIGSDYDYFVEFGGRTIACEVEAKLEKTRFSRRGIEQSIRRRAVKQLPTDSPGMIMLLVPLSWRAQKDFDRFFISVAMEVLQKNTHLCSVSAFWEVIHVSPDMGSRIGYGILEATPTGNPKLFARIHGDVPLTLGSQGSKWVALDEIVTRVIAERQSTE